MLGRKARDEPSLVQCNGKTREQSLLHCKGGTREQQSHTGTVRGTREQQSFYRGRQRSRHHPYSAREGKTTAITHKMPGKATVQQ